MTPANVVQQPIGDAHNFQCKRRRNIKTADEFGQAMWQKVQDTGKFARES